jgi:hypothetical protein
MENEYFLVIKMYMNDHSSVTIYLKWTKFTGIIRVQADLFALNTLMLNYPPFVNIRNIWFLKNLYSKWLISFDILIKRMYM